MKSLTILTISLAVVLALALGALAVLWQIPKLVQGNVTPGDECVATTTSAYTLNATTTTLKRGYGTLCSVVLTGPNTGAISFYNATTSDRNKRTGNVATSTLFIGGFAGAATSTTYAFNTTFTNGLLMVVESSPATTTVTFR